MQFRITKEHHPTSLGGVHEYDSIKYRLKVARRNEEGLGTLVKRFLDEQDITGILPNLRSSVESNAFPIIVDFFPNGYCSYPQHPTKADERRMRQGAGLILLDEMIQDARIEFSAKVIGAFRCSDSFSIFLEKNGFDIIYKGTYCKLL